MESGLAGKIIVAYVLDGRQISELFDITAETTVATFLQLSNVQQCIPAVVRSRAYGIYSRPADAQTHLSEGDRLEFYQPLLISPEQRRRQLADRANR